MARMYEVVRVVAQKNHLSIGWYQKEIRYSKKDFIDSLVEHLKEGDLVHLMVEGDRWTKNVYGIKERRGEKHAVLVVGYEKHDSIVEFSICDSMTNSKRSISVDKIFKSVVGSEFGKINNILHFGIPIGIFQGV